MSINWKEILERALWTFVEGFLIALPATFSLGMDGAAWKSALAGAAMAGLSATKTLLIEVVKKRKVENQNSIEGIEE
jgi:hypothetical protein